MAAAAARASALCGSIERRAADGVIPAAGAASALVPTSSADAGPAAAQDVARRAYFKAERRGFVPGHETDDWLEAERELTAPAACTDATAGLQPAGDA